MVTEEDIIELTRLSNVEKAPYGTEGNPWIVSPRLYKELQKFYGPQTRQFRWVRKNLFKAVCKLLDK